MDLLTRKESEWREKGQSYVFDVWVGRALASTKKIVIWYSSKYIEVF